MKSNWKNNRVKLIVFSSVVSTNFLVLSSCNQSFSLTWKGMPETYERTYKKYPEKYIQLSNTFRDYVQNKNLGKMLGQDIIYSLNYKCSLFSPEKFTYKFLFKSFHNNRLSFKASIFSSRHKMLMSIDATNLSYYSYYNDASDEVMFILKNVKYSHGEYYVNDEFWMDPNFYIKFIVLDNDEYLHFNFFWKELDYFNRLDFENLYVQFFNFTPWYYDDCEVIE